jgi:hypothetical protein
MSKTSCDAYHWPVFHKVLSFELTIKTFNSYHGILSCHSLKNMEESYVSYIYEITFVAGVCKTR